MERFKEKDLEDIIWTSPFACYKAGLECMIDHVSGCQVQRFRQPQLGPYGIGDILEITHATRNCNVLIVRLIECKRDAIGIQAYAQVKRYLTAVKGALADFVASTEKAGFRVEWKCVLIGRYVDAYNDFLHVLNNDADCEAYEYEQVGDGVLFSRAGLKYTQHSLIMPSALSVLGRRVAAGAVKAEEEVARIDAEMELEYPAEYWASLGTK